jgi:hypothetical protein
MAVLLFALPVYSQRFGVGAKVGIPITDYFETGASGSVHGGAHYSSATRRYTLGASVEWWVNRSFSSRPMFCITASVIP